MGLGTAIGAIGVGAQLWGANKASKSADKARDSENYWRGEQVDTARDQLAWNKGNYQQWVEQFQPILDELKTEALAGRTPDYAAITADTSAAFGSQRDQAQRNLGRYGIQPGDGQWESSERRFGIGEATAEVNARQNARRKSEDDRFSRLASVYGYGAGLTSSAMGGVNQGYGMIQGAQAGSSAMYGNQAREYGGLASDNMAGAWRGIGNMVNTAMNMGSDSGGNSAATGGGWNPSGYENGGNWRPPGYVGG